MCSSDLAAKRAAAELLVNGGAGAPTDRADFMTSTGAYAPDPTTGLSPSGIEDIDLWAGGLAEKRIFPAFDIATSGTRREEKLYKAEQIDAIYTLRRGLQQMPPQAAMEWLIKRIAATTSNDALLAGL